MANLYYNNTVNTAWGTLGNWWGNAGFNIPAAALPTTGDAVYLSGDMTSGPSTPVTLANIFVLSGAVNFTGAIGNATFSTDTFNQGTIDGNAIFNGTSQNIGLVQGNATFNDYSYNAISHGVSTATFNDYSYNDGNGSGSIISSGQIKNNAIFNDYSYNLGGIGYYTQVGTATFNDSSYNGGTTGVVATFNDTSYNNNAGISLGGYVFNDDSSNLRTDNSGRTATFNGPYAEGRIADNSSYGNLTINMTAPSGGSDNTIARLLDLPWFINI